jgi:hypothetical protein
MAISITFLCKESMTTLPQRQSPQSDLTTQLQGSTAVQCISKVGECMLHSTQAHAPPRWLPSPSTLTAGASIPGFEAQA